MAREREEGNRSLEARPQQERKESSGEVKYAYMFPGQASQAVGMGLELSQHSPAAREVFERINNTLEFDLSRLMFEGPAEKLQDTAYAQPAIFTVSLAALAASQEMTKGKMPAPIYMAGHSLGQFTAAVATGAIPLEEGARLVQERGRLMQKVSRKRPGAMAAIIGHLDEIKLEQILAETGVELANINGEDQIVLSGEKKALARAMDLAAASGARKVIPLPVSGAFHSREMKRAQAELQKTINMIEFNDPIIPIISNSEAEPLITGSDVQNELGQAMCKTVLWQRDIEYIRDNGATIFVELGNGKVLTTLIKHIDKNLKAFQVDSPESAEEFAQMIQQPASRNKPLNT